MKHLLLVPLFAIILFFLTAFNAPKIAEYYAVYSCKTSLAKASVLDINFLVPGNLPFPNGDEIATQFPDRYDYFTKKCRDTAEVLPGGFNNMPLFYSVSMKTLTSNIACRSVNVPCTKHAQCCFNSCDLDLGSCK